MSALALLMIAGCSRATDPVASSVGEQSDASSDDGETSTELSFGVTTLHSEFLSEGATFADFNRDGEADVVAGPYWYEGPDFSVRHQLYPPVEFDPAGYSDNFSAFAYDFNDDTWPDVLVVGFPGQSAAWFENPRADVSWPRHQVFDEVDGESPTFVDLTGDGKPELVCANAGRLGWAAPDWSDPTQPWVFHALSLDIGLGAFSHGLGVGDVDGDGRQDVIGPSGWWEQPNALDADPVWAHHDQDFGPGGAQMFAYDIDGDGDSDVVSTLEAHGYGVAWFEQTSAADEAFVKHVIAGTRSGGGTALQEPHALFVFDMDGDGLDDLITGERFWAHVPDGDPSLDDPARLVWFRLERDTAGPSFVAQTLDDQSGVGTQVVAGDIDGDGRADIVVANKKGAFVFRQRAP